MREGEFLRRKMEVVMQLVFHIICFIASPLFLSLSVDFVFARQLSFGSFFREIISKAPFQRLISSLISDLMEIVEIT